MTSTPPLPSARTEPEVSDEAANYLREVRDHETRNLLVLSLHFILLRIAWIFKTESVIIPAFLDRIAGAAWLRGCLPVLNRLGQSVPPLLLAERITQARQKKPAALLSSISMGVPFLVLAGVWYALPDPGRTPVWLAPAFLLLYTAFFSTTGVNQMTLGTLQGKLIRPERRGRLIGLAGVLGAGCSIVCAWILLRKWVQLPDGGYTYIFGFTGAGFVIAGLCCLVLHEPNSLPNGRPPELRNHFAAAWSVIRNDADFRKLALVAMTCLCAQILFPHYQALARMKLASQPRDLIVWVIAQNFGTGIFSPLIGGIADRSGNRLALRLQLFLAALTPLTALVLSGDWIRGGGDWYWLTFVLLGLTPVSVKTLVNYTLELADESQHPRYVSTMSVCMAAPFLASPLFGLLIDASGFEAAFILIAGILLVGGALTFGLTEPRLHQPPQEMLGA